MVGLKSHAFKYPLDVVEFCFHHKQPRKCSFGLCIKLFLPFCPFFNLRPSAYALFSLFLQVLFTSHLDHHKKLIPFSIQYHFHSHSLWPSGQSSEKSAVAAHFLENLDQAFQLILRYSTIWLPTHFSSCVSLFIHLSTLDPNCSTYYFPNRFLFLYFFFNPGITLLCFLLPFKDLIFSILQVSAQGDTP